MDKIVSEEFVEMLRDRLMAIRIKEYYTPNPRQVIFDEIKKEFEKHNIKVVKNDNSIS